MKTSLQWLKEYIHFTISAKELAHRLTLSGLEVEKEETVADDVAFEFEVTPNRPDCLSIIGIARELSAILDLPLKKPFIKSIKIPKEKSDVTITDENDCSRYIGAVLEHVCVKASPSALQKNLRSIGLRAINNVVDITNFCLMETGQPMHAFDLDKLEGRKIIVRRAKPNEKILAINDMEYTLDPSVLVIADEKKAVAIAGIMGGKDTEVTENTKTILLESASFDPILVRRASRKLGLRSDASYRFERGVDHPMIETACRRAINLIGEMSGGKLVAFCDAQARTRKTSKTHPISVDVEQIAKFLGTPLTQAKTKNILTRLEFDVASLGKNKLTATPPSFRLDVRTDIDVAEEIGRVIGFDHLATRLIPVNATNIPTSQKRILKERLAQLLVGQGLFEVIAYAMIGRKDIQRTKISTDVLVFNQNPLSEEQELMRPSSIPSMIKIAAHNFKNGQKDLALFELGRVYLPQNEQEVLAIALTGRTKSDWRRAATRSVDFYDLKGILEKVFSALGLGNVQFAPIAKEPFDPCQSVGLFMDEREIGFLGKVQNSILESYDIKHQEMFCAQVSLDSLWKERAQGVQRFIPFTAYPSIGRDVSVALKKDMSYQRLYETIVKLNEPLLRSIDLVEQYIGDKVPVGHKGMTISLTYRSDTRTLTESEVEEAHQRICQKVIDELSAIKR